MKKFVLLIIFVLSGFSFAQTSNDIVVYPINTKFLNSLVLELCNQRTLNDGITKQSNPTTFKCAEYQSSYLSTYEPHDTLFHDNQKPHRGVYLKTINDRKKYFNVNGFLASQTAEICTFSHITYGVTTYGELANHILDNFYGSKSHRLAILNNYPYGNFSCTPGKRKGLNGVYVVGFFSR